MSLETLAIARNCAVILLALEVLVLLAVPLFVLLKVTQGLRRLMPKIRPAMRKVYQVELRVTGVVDRGMKGIRAPFVWLASAGETLDTWYVALRRNFFSGR